jgi:hypothetical protein
VSHGRPCERTPHVLPFCKSDEHIRGLGEVCETGKRLFTQHLTDVEGATTTSGICAASQGRSRRRCRRWAIGGSGEQLPLQIIAQYADIRNHSDNEVEAFSHKGGVLHEHCSIIGRNPAEPELSVQTWVTWPSIRLSRMCIGRRLATALTALPTGGRKP